MSNHIETQVEINVRDLSMEQQEASHSCLVEVQVSERQDVQQFLKQMDLQLCRESVVERSPAEKADNFIDAAGSRAPHFISDRKERAAYVNTVMKASDAYTNALPREQGRVIGEIMLGTAVPMTVCELPQVKLMTRQLTEAGGNWHAINERNSVYSIQQADKLSCVAACGEMLSDRAIDQATLIEKIGAPAYPETLAKALGPEWKAGFVHTTQANHVIESLPSRGSWAAELRSVPALSASDRRAHTGHLVVVDGLDRDSNIMIRDPWEGTKYEMTQQSFMKAWTGRAVFHT